MLLDFDREEVRNLIKNICNCGEECRCMPLQYFEKLGQLAISDNLMEDFAEK